MNTPWNDNDLKEMANQLSSPKGEDGKKTAERMAISNKNMITRTIQQLNLTKDEHVLEIGHGNGSHVNDLIAIAPGLHYFGIDISETMNTEAIRINKHLVKKNIVAFELSNGNDIDFPKGSFDKIFTVNTIYFWEKPKAYAKEIYRVLKPGGSFCITFGDKKFMEKLPFTKWKFQLYDKDTVSALLTNAGFVIAKITEETEIVKGNAGETIERDFVIIRAVKNN